MAKKRMGSRIKTSQLVDIEGLDRLFDNCEQIKDDIRNKLSDIVLEGAEIVQSAAKSIAPVEEGALRDGIIAKVTWAKNALVAFAAAMMDPSKNDIFVKYTKDGKRYYYPASVEYGTRNTEKKNQKPFMRPAMTKARPAVKALIQARIKSTIEGAVK